MRRGPKPAKSKVESKPPVARKSAKNDSRIRDLQKQLAEALKREAEAREQQSATSEILRVISSSPTDVQPVFDAIVGQSLQLIGGFSAAVFRVVGEELHLVAYTSTSKSGDQALKAQFPRPAGGLVLEVIRQRTAAFVSDTETDLRMSEERRSLARARGWSAQLVVPILRQGKVLGIIR
jgi:GAF domain-containing protein